MPKKSSPPKTPTSVQDYLINLEITLSGALSVQVAKSVAFSKGQKYEGLDLPDVNDLREVREILLAAAQGDREAARMVKAFIPIAPGRGRYSERTDAGRREQGKVRKQKFDANTRRFKAAVAKELENLRRTILRRISALPLKMLRDRPLHLAKREAIRDRALTAAERSANPAVREAALQAKALQIQGLFP